MSPARFAAALDDAATEITRRTPAPRAFPFLGLDLPEGCASRLLDRLSDLGIFRFYERVLEIGPGLGGASRWLARRRGCRVVAIVEARFAPAARRLTRKAYLEGQVALWTARPLELPAPTGAFTHAWSVESLHRLEDRSGVFREAFRAVRPGGYFAIQDWMAPGAAESGGWSVPYAAVEDCIAGLRAAGFRDAQALEVSDLRDEESAVAAILRERVEEILGEPDARERPAIEAFESALAEREEGRARGRLGLYQIIARRPA